MDVVNFLPLLAWMLLMPLLTVIGDRIQGKKMTKVGAKSVAVVWLGVSCFWFFVGVLLSLTSTSACACSLLCPVR